MFKKTGSTVKLMLPIGFLVLVAILAMSSVSIGGDDQPFPPGSRLQGYHPDALLILHNLGAGASLRLNSEGTGSGLIADSKNGDGVAATTANASRSAVFGHSTVGIGVKGRSDNKDGVVGWTGNKDASGVYGHSTVGVGVAGRSDNKDGIVGWTGNKDASGVYGRSSEGIGVTGFSEDSTGVYGRSTDGFGVIARSDHSTALFVDGTSIFKNFASFEGGHGDLAENYYGSGDLEGGDVVRIDNTAGMTLTLADRANDSAVAGIVSTAPSMKLTGQIDNETGVPLVVAGRALCKVDASYGAITPGDLLTSSPTPGHAMKAQPILVDGVELHRSGTIVGKALESWSDGKGLITVLVTLQ